MRIAFACFFHNAKRLNSFCTELNLERVTQSSRNHNELNDTLLLGTLTVALHIIWTQYVAHKFHYENTEFIPVLHTMNIK